MSKPMMRVEVFADGTEGVKASGAENGEDSLGTAKRVPKFSWYLNLSSFHEDAI